MFLANIKYTYSLKYLMKKSAAIQKSASEMFAMYVCAYSVSIIRRSNEERIRLNKTKYGIITSDVRFQWFYASPNF